MLANGFGVGLVLLAAALPFSIAISSLIFFSLLGFWVLGGPGTWRTWPPRWGWTEKAFALFLAVSFISSLAGRDPGHSLHEMYKKDLYFLILLWVSVTAVQGNWARRAGTGFLTAGFLSAVWGIMQYWVGVNQTDRTAGEFIYIPADLVHWPRDLLMKLSLTNGRSHGTLSHPLSYAESLLFVLGFALAGLAFGESRKSWLWIPFIWILGLALIVSQSRGPWLAAVAMTLLMAVACRGWGKRLRFLLLALPVCSFLIVPSLRLRASTITNPAARSNSERLHMWQLGGQLWKAHPVLGVGPGNVKKETYAFLNADERFGGGWGHLHSLYVNFAAERGGAGLAAYLLFLLALASDLCRGFRAADPQGRMMIWAALGGGLGFLVSGLTETTYNTAIISMTFYFVMGLGLASGRHREDAP